MTTHILGICGTFMGGIAQLALEKGIQVTGADQNIYPPMSTQLERLGIPLTRGYEPENQPPGTSTWVIGNVMSRGQPIVEKILSSKSVYVSGPEWLYQNVLSDRHVIAVAGTHGKTTTTSMLAWVLDCAGFDPGFLIGGVSENFGCSARLGSGDYFIVEADEYDTAFFDKRSKFVHYKPDTLILNNLEFDHADIFKDLLSIQTQFHHLLRLIPSDGDIILNGADQPLQEVIEQGCWTPLTTFIAGDFELQALAPDYSAFQVLHHGQSVASVKWSLMGEHNAHNALGVIATAERLGISPENSAKFLAEFKPPKRRMELLGEVGGVKVFEDFAHHPTAISTTLAGLRAHMGSEGRILAAIEPRSHTMRMGVHQDRLGEALALADYLWIFEGQEGLNWDTLTVCEAHGNAMAIQQIDQLVEMLSTTAQQGDVILLMSNGSFGGIYQPLLAKLAK